MLLIFYIGIIYENTHFVFVFILVYFFAFGPNILVNIFIFKFHTYKPAKLLKPSDVFELYLQLYVVSKRWENEYIPKLMLSAGIAQLI
jgi:hypothetical protein